MNVPSHRATRATAPAGRATAPAGRANRRRAVAVLVTSAVAAMLGAGSGTASAAMVPNVSLGTAGNYSVLGASTVTNTGNTILHRSLGLSPGTSITGFPPGILIAPATTDQTNAAAAQAQVDLTSAYVDAANRPIDATTTAQLANLHLMPGVYSGPSKGALQLSGPLVLDGGGNLDSVFIFQTDSTLTTASGSTISLVNGAQSCNIYWQVGSSATLGSGSTFRGNILAQASVTVNNGVVVYGRALARTGAVTLQNDLFTRSACNAQPESTPATTVPAGTGTTVPAGTGTTAPGSGSGVGTGTDLDDLELPATGSRLDTSLVLASVLLVAGIAVVGVARRRSPQPR